ncbi:hypothetical protein CRE_22495 [Caenorhabditis remanei]|uniref:Uncharacterized protein n=1 Tax=Caenorhabditis remanei TaxID=31234 RepID=E3MU25_CAERE|nr:hypothetical protein CRE_22495 [Caenorhabditis remanei]
MKSQFLILFLPFLVNCQRELDCGFLNSTFEYEDWKNVTKTYVGGCCTLDCLEWLDTNVSDWREKLDNWNSYIINILYDQHCCNDTPATVGTTETSTIIPFTTPTTTIISVDEHLDCHWLRDPFNYSNGLSYTGSCCTQQCLDYLSWTNPLWMKFYEEFSSRMEFISRLNTEAKCCVGK